MRADGNVRRTEMKAGFASFATRLALRRAVKSLLVAAAVLAASVARANDRTPSVKDPLASVRTQLTHYDLEPQGTLALLPKLAELMRTLQGKPEAAEAAFLHAAAANDLLFLAEFFGREQLRAGLAAELRVPPEALAAAIAGELKTSAQDVYREPALQALASLERKEAPEQIPTGAPDLRRDARFVRAAAALAKSELPGARFAALAADPCAESAACRAPYADYDLEARRALVYLQQLSAAAVRLEASRGLGDPLFEMIAPEVERDIAALRALVIRMAPRVPGDRRLMPKESLPAWPAPHVVVLARANELAYARTQQVRIGTNGDVVRVEDLAPSAAALTTNSSAVSSDPNSRIIASATKASADQASTLLRAAPVARAEVVRAENPTSTPSSSAPALPALSSVRSTDANIAQTAPTIPVFPAMATIPYDPADTSFATRSIDALVTAMKAARGDEASFRAWLVADAGITSQLPARALVSLRKAGARELFVAACTKDGALVASPIRLVLATVDPAAETPDLKLRVRLGGYSLDVGHGVTDIPRVRDEAGWHFDLPALHAQVSKRTPRTAAVSFMTDVAAEQLVQAMREVMPSKAPVDLVIQ
jgi:hypothetical protein